MSQINDLSHHFLVAMPSMDDVNFHQTVTYVCEHNEGGAIGIIINRPTRLTCGEVFSQIDIETEDDTLRELPVLFGGPVQQDKGFVIHRPQGNWQSTLNMSDDLSVTTSRDILQAIAKGEGPEDILIALGYVGWGPKQLEQEIMDNVWLSCPAQVDLLFKTPYYRRWQVAAGSMGVDLDALSDETGHA